MTSSYGYNRERTGVYWYNGAQRYVNRMNEKRQQTRIIVRPRRVGGLWLVVPYEDTSGTRKGIGGRGGGVLSGASHKRGWASGRTRRASGSSCDANVHSTSSALRHGRDEWCPSTMYRRISPCATTASISQHELLFRGLRQSGHMAACVAAKHICRLFVTPSLDRWGAAAPPCHLRHLAHSQTISRSGRARSQCRTSFARSAQLSGS